MVGSPRVGSAYLTHQGEDNVTGEEEGGLDHQRSGVSRRSSTAHPLVSRKSSAATSYKTAGKYYRDSNPEIQSNDNGNNENCSTLSLGYKGHRESA